MLEVVLKILRSHLTMGTIEFSCGNYKTGTWYQGTWSDHKMGALKRRVIVIWYALCIMIHSRLDWRNRAYVHVTGLLTATEKRVNPLILFRQRHFPWSQVWCHTVVTCPFLLVSYHCYSYNSISFKNDKKYT